MPTDSLIVDCKDSPEAVERSSGYRALSAFFRRVDNARARFAKNYHPSAHNLSMVERAKKSGADGSRDAAGKLLLSPSHPSDTCRIYTPDAGTHPPLFILKSLAGNYLINPSLRDGEFGKSVFQRFLAPSSRFLHSIGDRMQFGAWLLRSPSETDRIEAVRVPSSAPKNSSSL